MKPTIIEIEHILDKHEKEHEEQMKDIIKPLELKTFKAYPLIVAIMAMLQMMAILYGRHFIELFGSWHLALGNLIFTPMILYIFQIVAECYGWQYARQIVWCNFVFNGLATFFTFVLQFVPYSDFTHPDLKMSYIHFVDTIWVSCLINWLVIFASDYISTATMSSSKNFTQGRFLFIRLLLVHILSEFILLLGGAFGYFYNHYNILQIFDLQVHMFIMRLIISIILLPFILAIILFIQKRVEKVVAFDNSRSFWNIFHWSIQDKETIQFDYDEWSKLSVEKKKRIDISKINLDYYTDEKLGVGKVYKNDHIKK